MILDNPSEIFDWDTEKLWGITQTILEEENLQAEYKQETEWIRRGINIKIPIHYIIKKWYEEYPATKRAKIQGHGKHDLEEFLDEIEDRKKLMRLIIQDNLEESGITEKRT